MKKGIALLIAMLFMMICSACSGQEESPESSDFRVPVPAGPEKASESASVAVGGMITFGRYEQDNNPDNGPEPIEWTVLDVRDGKALLISRFGLDAVSYYTEPLYVTWETSTLRAWLNSDFLNKAFSAEEQSAILTTAVDNSAGQGYSEWTADGGNNTEDRIFLLSYMEANRYLGVSYADYDNMKSRLAPTEYAIARGAGTNETDRTADGSATASWWLRSPGEYRTTAATVRGDGSLNDSPATSYNKVVRPVLWVDLDSGAF